MTDDRVSHLNAQGIDAPEMYPLPLAAGVTAMGFPSEGGEALAWWRRLRTVNDRMGFWPVIIPSTEEAVRVTGHLEVDPARRLTQATELDPVQFLNPKGTFESLDEQLQQDMLDRWPARAHRLEHFGLPFLRDGRPASVLVALITATHGWQVPTLLGYGNWNECPEPATHGAVLRYWGDRYGAELVCMSATTLELTLRRPPRSRQEALAFAWEYPRYCLDGMDQYDAEDVPDLAACLIDAEIVRFWWD